MRAYIIPVKRVCNSNCSFCFMKEKKINDNPDFMELSKLRQVIQNIEYDEVEITGGGEPTLHPQINGIISAVKKPNTKIKLYTNGFKLCPLEQVDELNISRVSEDSDINNLFYRSKSQNDILDVLKYYRPLVKTIRMQTILLNGAIDTQEKALKFIEKLEKYVDVFMFRTLFSKCSLEKDNFMDFAINHKKAVMDKTLDTYDRLLYFIDTNCNISKEFKYD